MKIRAMEVKEVPGLVDQPRWSSERQIPFFCPPSEEQIVPMILLLDDRDLFLQDLVEEMVHLLQELFRIGA